MTSIIRNNYLGLIEARRRRRNRQAAKRIEQRLLEQAERTVKLELPQVQAHACEKVLGASYCPHCGMKLA
jgi:hypothetical protein